MVTDRARIQQMQQALARLKQARSYQQQATRMVKEAEATLRAAVVAACGVPPPSHDGEQKAEAA